MKRPGWVLTATALGLAGLTIWLFWPGVHNGFLDWDDLAYLQGAAAHPRLTWPTVRWAFTATEPFYYHPLARLSHVLDYQLWGWNPVGHHLPNILLHGANTALVTVLAWCLAGAVPSIRQGERWAMAAVVGLGFGIHPLQVESVAWIAERKNVLCGFFSLAALVAYVRSLRGGPAAAARPARFYWWLSLVLATAAMLSKPMAVSVPVAMLAIDLYPFGRVPSRGWGRLILEKAWLFVFGAGVSVVTLLPSIHGGAVASLGRLTLITRCLVAARNYVFYLWKLLWPSWLSPYYPLEGAIPIGAPEFWLSGVVMVVVTAWVIWRWRRAPALAAGWLGYLGLLLPVSGFFQTGAQATADRFMYLAMIPVLLLLAGVGLWAWRNFGRLGRWAVLILVGCELLFWGYTTRSQIGVWRNDLTLWSEVLGYFPNSGLANAMMGNALVRARQYDLARPYAQKAAALSPGFYKAYATLGQIDYQAGRFGEAAGELELALRSKPDLALERYRLAGAYSRLNRLEPALDALRLAVAQDPSLRQQAAVDPAFEPLRHDPGFARQLEALLDPGRSRSPRGG